MAKPLRLHILVIDALSEEALEYIREVGEVEYCPGAPQSQIVAQLAEADVLVLRSGYRLTPEWFANAGRLRAVIRAGVGLDNIPVEYIKRRGILLTTIPTATTVSVAEYALGAILLLLRNMIPGYLGIMKGQWLKDALIGHELTGKTVGLLGYGNVGRALAERLQPFGVRLIANHRSAKIGDVHNDVRMVSLEELAADADIISVQVPLTAETRYLVNRKMFTAMKRSPYLVNVSRYDVVDMSDLRTAVADGTVRAAFIDPTEPDRLDPSAFADLPIFLFPHLGGSTYEAQARVGQIARDQLVAWDLIPGASPPSEVRVPQNRR